LTPSLLSSVFFVMSYAFFIFLYHNLPLLSCITFPLLCAQLLFLYIVSLGCQRSVPPAFSMFQLLFSFLVYVLPIVFYLPRGTSLSSSLLLLQSLFFLVYKLYLGSLLVFYLQSSNFPFHMLSVFSSVEISTALLSFRSALQYLSSLIW